jgi:archaellin
MVIIRRSIGGVVLAAVAAAVLVGIPAQAQVRATTTTTTSTTTGTTTSSSCDTIRQTIKYIEATYDEPMETVLAAPWRSAAALYGCASE